MDIFLVCPCFALQCKRSLKPSMCMPSVSQSSLYSCLAVPPTPDPCAGVVCPAPGSCQTGGYCLKGQCQYTNLPQGNLCNGDWVCTAEGMCKGALGIMPGSWQPGLGALPGYPFMLLLINNDKFRQDQSICSMLPKDTARSLRHKNYPCTHCQ